MWGIHFINRGCKWCNVSQPVRAGEPSFNLPPPNLYTISVHTCKGDRHKKSKSLNINLVCWELIDLEGNVKRINMWKHFIANRDTKTMLWNGNNYRHGLWHCGDKFTWASKFPSGEWVVPVVWLWKSCGWALDRLRMRVCHKRGGHESFTVALYYFCFHCRASLSL